MAKATVILIIILILAAVMVSAVIHARSRAKMLYCQNNLRCLGQLAQQMVDTAKINPGDELMRGRKFWQQCRENFDRDNDGKWKVRPEDPYVCPVLGTTKSDYGNVETIDYRGPKLDPTTYKKDQIFAADRASNHQHNGGINVLTVDLAVFEGWKGIEVAPLKEGEKADIETVSD